MNGAESLVHTLLASDVTVCFANPGTSEMHFVAALDRISGMHCILCLAEGVVTGAADGYGRIAQKPAATLLHCGPGLGNGLANLHNARRAKSQIVNLVGDQASYHRPLDPPLTADTENWARGVSAWTRTAGSAASIGWDTAVAVQAARSLPGIATLIAPAETGWDEGGIPGAPLEVVAAPQVAPHRIIEIAGFFRKNKEPVLILLGAAYLTQAALYDAYCISQASNATLLTHQFNARVERGQGRFPVKRLAYGVNQAIEILSEFKHVVLIGALPPVAPFAYPDKPGYLLPADTMIHVLARPDEDVAKALASLAGELAVEKIAIPAQKSEKTRYTGPNSPEAVTGTLAALLPENAIVIDESVSFGRNFFDGLAAAPPHDWLQITGGAIGTGLPMAVGAAIAAPGRRVISLQADGAAMYSVQALWTQARQNLSVTTVILSNRKYAILLGELASVGATAGQVALDMLNIGQPDIQWVDLARSLGVEAARAETIEEFAELFTAANRKAGPFLIELII